MATGLDFRDRLQLPTRAQRKGKAASGATKNDPPTETPMQEPEDQEEEQATQRDLYSLIGDNAPSLAMAKGWPKTNGRLPSRSKATKWTRVPFKNPARKDNLLLHHWVPNPSTAESADPEASYPFASFNAPPNVYSYSPDEYTNLLQDEDWTREETEYLFRLCQQFDLRFIIIHDRYDYPSRHPRSLEDLKARYYDCCRKLIAGRPAADEQAKNLAMNSYLFDKAREVNRKAHVRALLDRTPQELAEEEFLYIESRKLEQTYSQTLKERESLLRLLGGPGSGAPRRDNDITFTTSISGAPPGPRLVGAAAAAAANKAANATRATAKAANASQVPVDPAFDAQHHITRLEPSGQVTLNSFGLPRSGVYSAAGPSVTLRTARMPAVKTPLIPKVTEALSELGLSSRLIMPTCANQERLEALQSALSQLVDLKKTVERAEYEIGLQERSVNPHASSRAGSEAPEGSSVPPSGSVPPPNAGDTSMADESVEIPPAQVQRSASVSSTQSGSRPPHKKKRKR